MAQWCVMKAGIDNLKWQGQYFKDGGELSLFVNISAIKNMVRNDAKTNSEVGMLLRLARKDFCK